MVEATRPVDGDIGLVVCQLAGSVERSTGIQRAVAVEAIKYWTVIAHVIRVASIGHVRKESVGGRHPRHV